MKKILGFAFLLMTLGFMSCSPSPVGTWIEPTGGSEEISITLNKDGSVNSMNMGFTEFESWEKNGDLLILKGNYVGSNKREFSDTMKIEKLTDTELKLSHGGYEVSYVKKN